MREESMFKREDYFTSKLIRPLISFILWDEKNELRYPDYQRDYVWSNEDKINLIESIFDNIEIGRIVVHEEFNTKKPVDTWCFEIIDGKQRLSAILDYYKNKFAVRDKYFKDLSNLDKQNFKMILIPVTEVKNLNKKQQIELFIKVNTTGKVMDKKHLEKIKQMMEQ
jgi:hypothetical protein